MWVHHSDPEKKGPPTERHQEGTASQPRPRVQFFRLSLSTYISTCLIRVSAGGLRDRNHDARGHHPRWCRCRRPSVVVLGQSPHLGFVLEEREGGGGRVTGRCGVPSAEASLLRRSVERPFLSSTGRKTAAPGPNPAAARPVLYLSFRETQTRLFAYQLFREDLVSQGQR